MSRNPVAIARPRNAADSAMKTMTTTVESCDLLTLTRPMPRVTCTRDLQHGTARLNGELMQGGMDAD